MQTITSWLESVGLPEYVNLFVEHNIDVDVLRDLTDQDLETIGVPLGHRKRMLRAIAPLRDPPRPEFAGDEAQRRQLTLMFCDLVGSTRLSRDLDPEDMGEVMNSYQSACASVISTYDGFIARFIGDGILAYFGFPAAHEDDAERAVRAGLEIKAAMERLTTRFGTKLQVRIGIATGLVVVSDLAGRNPSESQLAVGETPNLAARLPGVADPGGVVIATSTRRLIGDLFNVRDLGLHELKGVSQPVRAWAVDGLSGSELRFEAVHPAHLTDFVGREDEIGQLLERKNLAWKGEGQTVLISGEAGIGKSRLAVQLGECVASEAHTRLRYQCSPYHSSSALYPFIAWLERTAEIKADDPPEQRLDKLEALLAARTENVAAVAPLFAALLSIPFAGRYPPLALSPAQQRNQTFAAILDQLDALARQQPVLCIFEDMQWADATSLELLELVAERIARLPVLMLITSRPGHEPAWTNLPNVSALTLGRLDQPHVQRIVQRVTGGRALPADVMDHIVAKTDGVPLFVEELTKTVLETGILVEESDGYRLERPLPLLAIPATLHDSLMARLDRLPRVKEVAQIAAAIGREFSYDLLSAVSGRNEFALNAALSQLEDAELVFRSGEPPATTYSFKHALVRDTAYESLLKSRRQTLHRRIADALEQHFASVCLHDPGVLGLHREIADEREAAVPYFLAAGQLALERFAVKEANAYLQRGLALMETLPHSDLRNRQELGFRSLLGRACIFAKGWADRSVNREHARALELSRNLGMKKEQVPLEWALATNHLLRGEVGEALVSGRRVVELAEDMRDQDLLHVAHSALAIYLFYSGDFATAIEHKDKALRFHRAESSLELQKQFGTDRRLQALRAAALSYWCLGNHRLAVALDEEQRLLAMKSGYAYEYTYALTISCIFHSLRRAAEETLSFAETARKIARDEGFSFLEANAENFRTLALALQHPSASSLADCDRAIEKYQSAGNRMGISSILAIMAEICGRIRLFDRGIDYANRAIDYAHRSGEHFAKSDLYRVKGEILAAAGSTAEAEDDFCQALQTARAQAARTWELGAAIPFARLLLGQGRAAQATEVLQPLCLMFQDSAFASDQLNAARAMLAQ
jgi:predicted ATPase/class 3 adenylate cyclase